MPAALATTMSHYLARSAKLPTGLYKLIYLPFLSLFFTLSKAISESTVPIFTIFFHQMGGICVNVVNPDQFFRFLKGEREIYLPIKSKYNTKIQ